MGLNYTITPTRTNESYISSNFGYRYIKGSKSYHYGIDIGSNGKPIDVFAIVPSKVFICGLGSGITGNRIFLHGVDNLFYFYCHLSEIYVHNDELIQAGQLIGKSGNSGSNANNPFAVHLHFELRLDFNDRTTAMNPLHISSQYRVI